MSIGICIQGIRSIIYSFVMGFALKFLFQLKLMLPTEFFYYSDLSKP
jgi:hypothetical protein